MARSDSGRLKAAIDNVRLTPELLALIAIASLLFRGLGLRGSIMSCFMLPAVVVRLCRAPVFQSWRESAMGNLRGSGVRVILFCVALILIAVAATPASAQTFRGTILGTVTDSSGAAVLNAKVTVHNVDTGVDRMTETTSDGGYLMPELPVGMYDVTAELNGFQKAKVAGVTVSVAAERRV